MYTNGESSLGSSGQDDLDSQFSLQPATATIALQFVSISGWVPSLNLTQSASIQKMFSLVDKEENKALSRQVAPGSFICSDII